MGKHLQYDRNKDLKQYLKNLFFFDISKTLENNKDEIFKLLNTFENLFLKPESKTLWPVDRSGRPSPVPGQRAQVCARRSTDSGTRSTGPVDRQSLAGSNLGQKTGLENILINPINLLKIHKNSFIILHG